MGGNDRFCRELNESADQRYRQQLCFLSSPFFFLSPLPPSFLFCRQSAVRGEVIRGIDSALVRRNIKASFASCSLFPPSFFFFFFLLGTNEMDKKMPLVEAEQFRSTGLAQHDHECTLLFAALPPFLPPSFFFSFVVISAGMRRTGSRKVFDHSFSTKQTGMSWDFPLFPPSLLLPFFFPFFSPERVFICRIKRSEGDSKSQAPESIPSSSSPSPFFSFFFDQSVLLDRCSICSHQMDWRYRHV